VKRLLCIGGFKARHDDSNIVNGVQWIGGHNREQDAVIAAVGRESGDACWIGSWREIKLDSSLSDGGHFRIETEFDFSVAVVEAHKPSGGSVQIDVT